jgi:HPt (histidine-containing phosphotransfer) domain-containing protein
MDPEDRDEIRSLCASDMERTRTGVSEALGAWNPEALARQLHVMSSLAATVGADALAEVAGRMQLRLKSGNTTGYDESARMLDKLARSAVKFLAETAE